jgi:hypothetical protein
VCQIAVNHQIDWFGVEHSIRALHLGLPADDTGKVHAGHLHVTEQTVDRALAPRLQPATERAIATGGLQRLTMGHACSTDHSVNPSELWALSWQIGTPDTVTDQQRGHSGQHIVYGRALMLPATYLRRRYVSPRLA